MIALTAAKQAFHALKTRPLHVLLSSAVDILFLFLYGFLTQYPRDNAFTSALKLEQAASQLLANANAAYDTPSMLQLFFDRLALPHALSVLFWLLILLLTAYVLYALFQGFAWKLASGTNLAAYAKLTAFWFGLLGIAYFITAVIDMRAILVQTLTQQTPSSLPHTILTIITYVLLALFLLATGALTTSWKHANTTALRIATLNITQLIPPAVLLVASTFVFNAILMWLFTHNQLVGIIVGVLTIFPGLFAARVYITRVTEAIHARQHA